jgi:hypothetical protein
VKFHILAVGLAEIMRGFGNLRMVPRQRKWDKLRPKAKIAYLDPIHDAHSSLIVGKPELSAAATRWAIVSVDETSPHFLIDLISALRPVKKARGTKIPPIAGNSGFNDPSSRISIDDCPLGKQLHPNPISG